VLVGTTGIAAVLALGAALMVAIGDVLQQRSAQQVTDKPVSTIGLFRRLLRDRRWWAGSLVAGAGFGLQAAALGFGSVVLVQALLVTSLLFALVINATVNHRRVTRRQGIWAVLLAAAVTVVVTVGDPQAGTPRGSVTTWAVVALVMGPALILCVIGSRMFSGSVSASLLGLTSGALWGLFSVLTKGVVDQLGRGVPALLRAPEVYVWVALAIAATALEQSAFRAGPLTASLPATTVAEPIVGSVLGVTVLGETLKTNTVGMVALGVSVAVMIAATVALAHSRASGAPADGKKPPPSRTRADTVEGAAGIDAGEHP
jgi:drug/metabolite transporter (DMT)-like permease